jgi:hypothetical protein
MKDVKSSISQGQSYQEIGEYWDNHDLGEVWDQTETADFVLSGHAKTTYYPVESNLSQKLHAAAQQRGVSAQTLLNLWLQEKVTQEPV